MGGIVHLGESRPRRNRKRSVRFQDRDFVVWDGEADKDNEERSNYVLFGNSDGWELSAKRLTTDDCLGFIIDYERANPGRIHIGFAIGFDVNMFVRDLPKSKILELKETNQTYYQQYKLEYLPKKWFYLYDTIRKIGVKIFDIFTFFMCSAVKAWQEYLPDDPDVSFVSEGKNLRDNFQYEELETVIRPYFRVELALYERLVSRLRYLLGVAGIHPRGWYGPGAIAGELLRSNAVPIVRNLPDGVVEASAYAYFGGRFEQFRTGRYDGPVYSADIRSAYPHALRLCPDLSRGEWVHHSGIPDHPIQDFALYKIDFDYDRQGHPREHSYYLPMPFPHRDIRGAVHYPARTIGWYWGCEVKAALEYYSLDILESWEFQPSDDSRPFGFLERMYERRMEWKNRGQQAQLALKLGMNSIYGKTAQRVGKNNLEKPPTWHQLEYAGFATAMCRSMIFTAIMKNPLSIIAVETDGVFSTQPLDLPYSKSLGQWEQETYDGCIYVQSGVYWMRRHRKRKQHRWVKAKIRGFAPGQVTRSDAIRHLRDLSPIRGKTTRFAAFNGYLFKHQWLQWIVADHLSRWGGGGKRTHTRTLCPKCCGSNDQLHTLNITFPYGGVSHKHFLPWRDTVANEFEKVSNARNQLDMQASGIISNSPHSRYVDTTVLPQM